jgi:cation diffusion facilitator CzcD-associated flavoprotein CzcO
VGHIAGQRRGQGQLIGLGLNVVAFAKGRSMVNSCDAIVIGAGPAGLAAAAALRARGLNAAILEKSNTVGAVWRRHYDRLHLHTDRARSSLPGLPIPKAYGRYPSRAQVVEYLEAYAAQFALKPVFNAPVHSVGRYDQAWRAQAGENSQTAPIVIVATGLADYPYEPTWPGMETFGGLTLHSSAYHNPTPFAGKRVLIVGYGNSGAEIALDLSEAGVDVTLAVRGPVNVIPRELFGLPILAWGLTGRLFPSRVADTINAPLLQFATGSIEKLGLKRSPKGPLQSIEEDRRVPLIDAGTLDAIRDGRIKLLGDMASFTCEGVEFKQSPAERFDAIILATGFRPDLRPLLPDAKGVLNAAGAPLVSGRATAEPGLFFCGAIPSALGQLRQIGIEAQRIADAAWQLRAA